MVEPAQQPIMLDVDTGIDDALAIALALRCDANLVGISTVAGNVGIEDAARNTCSVLAWMGVENIPVYRGASRALVAEGRRAIHVHGKNGLGGVEAGVGDVPVSSISGIEALVQAATRFEGDLVIVALGPLTNVAMALSIDPSLARRVRTLVVMGGAFTVPGNVTPFAEFNAHVDPHAFEQVMRAPWNDIVVIGLDVTQRVRVSRRQWENILEDAGGAAGLVREITGETFARKGSDGFVLHDPLALAVALQPDLVNVSSVSVAVQLDGERQGQTRSTEPGRVSIATGVDAGRFGKFFAGRMGIPTP